MVHAVLVEDADRLRGWCAPGSANKIIQRCMLAVQQFIRFFFFFSRGEVFFFAYIFAWLDVLLWSWHMNNRNSCSSLIYRFL